MADIFRINAIIAYLDGSSSNYTSANDGQVIQISQTDFTETEAELFSWPSFRAFMESIDSIVLSDPIDITHIADIAWSVDIEDETGRRVVSGFEAPGGTGTNSNTTYDPSTFPNFTTGLEGLVQTGATATATMQGVGSIAKVDTGSGYVTSEEMTLVGGITSPVLIVSSLSTITGQTQVNFSAGEGFGSFTGGTGYSPGNVNTMLDGTVVSVTAANTGNGGEVTAFTITTTSSSGNANFATIGQDSSTGEGATGFSLTLTAKNQGVFAATYKSVAEVFQSGEYSVIPAEPVAAEAGGEGASGATFDLDWGVKNVTVTEGGAGYESVPAVSFSGGTASAATATLTDGSVSSITVTNPGSLHTVTTTVTIDPPVDE